MDETGQPGTEPARVNGNGAGNSAVPGYSSAWRTGADASRPESAPPAADTPGSLVDLVRPTVPSPSGDASWSPSADAILEPTTSPFASPWRSPLPAVPHGRAEVYPRYEMLAPVSPVVPPSTAAPVERLDVDGYHLRAYDSDADLYGEDLGPVAADRDREEWTAPWAPAQRDRSTAEPYRQPPAPPRFQPPAPGFQPPSQYQPAGSLDSVLDDLPALARATAASQAEQARTEQARTEL
ncbi:MAG TPA: hypothetical protein VJT31_29045, partial [Rugosimonospora sp.]|nr:hypothetical protein [Rugosimonospora sp.]